MVIACESLILHLMDVHARIGRISMVKASKR